MRTFPLILLFLALLSANKTWAKNVPIEAFSEGENYSQVKLSPTGKYLSFTSNIEGRRSLIILNAKNNNVEHVVRFPDNNEVGAYSWVNDKRLVLQKLYLKGWADHPMYYGELFGIDADGKNGRYLIGYQGENQVGSRIKKATPVYGTSYILDPLIDDDKHMLVYTIPWTSSKEPTTFVYKVNVKTGKRKRITRSPSRMAFFLTDNQGHVRVSLSTDDSINQTIHIRDSNSDDWRKFNFNINLIDINLHAFDQTGNKIYITGSYAGEPKGVFELNLKSGEAKKLLQDKHVSPKYLWVDSINHELFAVELEPGYPSYAFLDNNSKLTKRLKSLIKAIPGEQIQLISMTKDHIKSIVFASSDINPGTYYIHDAEKNKLKTLFNARESIDYQVMSNTRPFSFEARDGMKIHGYITLPFGKEAKNLPLVVMPHGGPHGPRDWWGFDPDAQLLANRGIAVLKVNFRGSGGYGREFEHAGHQKWGAEIQYDIIDATKYVIAEGYVDSNNMCIMGGSFGGYSALQSSIIEPDMFKCAIGFVGVYDLPLMFDEGDISRLDSGQRFLKSVLGTDEELLKAYSPSYNINKLKAPVLVIHGGEDDRAPIEQAESLIEALKKANHPYQYLLMDDEGHGFYKPEHRAKYYKTVLAFLDEHLKL